MQKMSEFVKQSSYTGRFFEQIHMVKYVSMHSQCLKDREMLWELHRLKQMPPTSDVFTVHFLEEAWFVAIGDGLVPVVVVSLDKSIFCKVSSKWAAF